MQIRYLRTFANHALTHLSGTCFDEQQILCTISTQDLMRPNIVYVPIKWSLRFYVLWYAKSHVIPDIVYVPINWLLRFYVPRFTKSHMTPDVVYVPMEWSLRFYVPRYEKSHAT